MNIENHAKVVTALMNANLNVTAMFENGMSSFTYDEADGNHVRLVLNLFPTEEGYWFSDDESAWHPTQPESNFEGKRRSMGTVL